MNRRELLGSAALGALGLGLSSFPLGWAQAAEAPRRKILFFSKSSGFEHPMIKRQGSELSKAEVLLTDWGKQHGFDVDCTKDGGVFTRSNLARYDAFFFYTTGDLTTPGTDKNPPMSPEGKAAFLDLIYHGKGFLGSHSASDTFHTRPDPPDRSNRYVAHGDAEDSYLLMLGAEFIAHGKQQKTRMKAVDPHFPGFAKVGDGFDMLEEWYSLKDFRKDLHVLLVQETEGMEGSFYHRGPYPATWARRHGQGRVFYTSMGHRDDVWANPLFQSILLGAISWATGNVQADVTPNLEHVCPTYAQIPPMPEPKK